MLHLQKTEKGLSFLYLVMLIPLMANNFSINLAKNKILETDPWLLLAFFLLVIMAMIFWLLESRKRIFANHLPYWMLTAVLLVLVLEPVLGYLATVYFQMSPYFIIFQKIVTWGVFLVVVGLAPYIAFSKPLEKRAKFLSVMIALDYVLLHFIPLMNFVSPRLNVFVMRIIGNYATWLIWMVVIYLILAYLMNNDLFGKQGGTWFIVTSLGMGLTYFGILNPVKYRSRGWYNTEIYEHGYQVGTGITQLFDINIWVIVGIGLLAFIFFIYLITKKDEVIK